MPGFIPRPAVRAFFMADYESWLRRRIKKVSGQHAAQRAKLVKLKAEIRTAENAILLLSGAQGGLKECLQEFMALTDAGVVEQQILGEVDEPPVITSTPSPTFTEGVSGTYDMTQHVSDDGLSTVTYSLTNTLPNGLSFNSSTGVLTYDGVGGASVSQHQLTATDAVGSDQSASFSIAIAAVGGTDTDWETRTASPTLIYSENFSTYTSDTELRAAADAENHIAGDREIVLSFDSGLSGGKCLKIRTINGARQNGGEWRVFLTERPEIYIQMHIRRNRASLYWRGDKASEQKLVLFNQNNSGQWGISGRQDARGFVLPFSNSSVSSDGHPVRLVGSVAYDNNTETSWTSNIDNGGTVATEADGIRRWGLVDEAFRNLYSYTDDNYEDDLFSPWPNTDAIAAGLTPFTVDEWLVVQIYYNNDPSNNEDRGMMWVAARNSAPYLQDDAGQNPITVFHNQTSTEWGLGGGNPGIDRIACMNFDTPRDTWNSASQAAMPTMENDFAEIIADSEPIPFPGHYPEAGQAGRTYIQDVNPPPWIYSLTVNRWARITQSTNNSGVILANATDGLSNTSFMLRDVDAEDDSALNPNYPNDAPWHLNYGLDGVLRGWSSGPGFCRGLYRSGALVLHGSGHNSERDNSIYAFDIWYREWRRKTANFESLRYPGTYSSPYANTEYPDGPGGKSPVMVHTTSFPAWDHTRQRLINPAVGTYNEDLPSNPAKRTCMWEFDWHAGPTITDAAGNIDEPEGVWTRNARIIDEPDDQVFAGNEGCGFYVDELDEYWMLSDKTGDQNPGANVANWNRETDTWTPHASIPSGWFSLGCMGAYYPGNNFILGASFNNNTRIFGFSTDNPNGTYTALNEVNSGIPRKVPDSPPFMWSKKRQSFLYMDKGNGTAAERATVVELIPPNSSSPYANTAAGTNLLTGNWTWRNLGATVGADVVLPQSRRGRYRKADLGIWGREEAIIHVEWAGVGGTFGDWNNAVYALRIPSTDEA